MPAVPAIQPMVADQGDFLGQLKNFARGFMQWISEEGNEQEHPPLQGGSSMPMPASADGGMPSTAGGMPATAGGMPQDAAPTPTRVKTTTVTDYAGAPGTPTGAGGAPAGSVSLAADPASSQAQRGAMGAAAGGNSNLGIPQGVGQEFMNADPGGPLPTKKTNDAAPGSDPMQPGRFTMSPDGTAIIDNQSGKSFSVADVLQMCFGNGGQADAATPSIGVNKPQAVTVAPPARPEGKWSIPPMGVKSAPGGTAQAPTQTSVSGTPRAPANAAAGPGKWASPTIKDNGLGEGVGGKVLGQLLNYTAGGTQEDCGPGGRDGIGSSLIHGAAKVVETANKYGADRGGWKSPKFGRDGGPGSGPQSGGGGTPAPTKIPPAASKPTGQKRRPFGPTGATTWDAGTSEGAAKAAETRKQGSRGFGGAAAAASHPEGFVQGVGGLHKSATTAKPAPEPFRGYDSRT